MIAILDYDAGNIKSVEKALQFLGEEAVITRDKELIMNSDAVILPGVGAFGDAMDKLRHYDLESVIKEYVASGKPFLGICLGLQLMFAASDETPGAVGLGLLEGTIKTIPTEVWKSDGSVVNQVVPQIGWNNLSINPKSRLLKGIDKDEDGNQIEPYVYFVHSYYLEAKNPEDVAARTEYGVSIDCAVEKGNLFACQFHPEKSSDIGLKILRNFIDIKNDSMKSRQ